MNTTGGQKPLLFNHSCGRDVYKTDGDTYCTQVFQVHPMSIAATSIPAGRFLLTVWGLLLIQLALPSSANHPDGYPPVSYRGFQLWSVTTQSESQRLSLIQIQQDYGKCMILSNSNYSILKAS